MNGCRQRFIGVYDTKPTGYEGNTWVFQEDFGFLRKDGILVVSPKGSRTDGASLPRFFWRILGHPLHGGNKYWSAGHDSGYQGSVILINTYKYVGTPEKIFDSWRDLDPHGFIHRADLNRKWFDLNMLETMEFMKVGWLKRRMVYRGVRLGGRKAYRKDAEGIKPLLS